MVRSLYTSASGMLVNEIRVSVTANNLANIDTTGYKKDEAVVKSFPNILLRRVYDLYLKLGRIEAAPEGGVVFKGASAIGGVEQEFSPSALQTRGPAFDPNPGHILVEPGGGRLPRPDRIDLRPAVGFVTGGAIIDDIATNYEQGSLRETNNPLDLALMGEGFFVLTTPLGPRYARDGNFTINSARELVTHGGYQVMGLRGPVTLPSEDFFIDEEGYIYLRQLTDDGVAVYDRQNPYDRIRVVDFQDKGRELKKVGDNLYREEPTSTGPLELAHAGVLQGYLENSNVNPVDMMVRLIEVFRSYEANQKSIAATDETLGKAVTEVGRL